MINAGQLKDHIDALEGFERDYRRYIESQEAEYGGDELGLTGEQQRALRRDLLRRVDAAERALQAVGKMIRVEPPAFYGGPVLTSLSDQIFAHETPRFGGTEGREFDLPNGLLDTMLAAIGALEDQLKAAQRSGEGLADLEVGVDPKPRQKPAEVKADGTPWYHNPWVVTIGSTVIGGAILVLIFGT